MDLQKIKKIHFVGIKGVAMTALAIIAKEQGINVTGSDVKDQFPTDESLRKADIKVLEGFSSRHIAMNCPDCVVYTGAHNGKENVEVIAAVKKGIPVFPHGQALGIFMEGKRQIAVAGSHGKTTTTAMIATILKVAGLDPSYAVGCGEIFGLGLPGHR
jgi:UDP-N-acetylmuramate--alanine ligase